MTKKYKRLITLSCSIALIASIVTPIGILLVPNKTNKQQNLESNEDNITTNISFAGFSKSNNNKTIIVKKQTNQNLNWYISSNKDLDNDIQIQPLNRSNNKVELMIPNNYKGNLFYFAKDKQGTYTNSIKINVTTKNNNYKFINVGLLGSNKPTIFHYIKTNTNKVNLIHLSSSGSNISTSATSTSDLMFYQLSEQYTNFFETLFNYMSQKNIYSTLSFSSMSSSCQIYLPTIIQNWNDYSITQINFINSNDTNFNSNIDTNWNNLSLEGMQLIIQNKNNEDESYTIAIPSNIYVSSYMNSFLAGIYNEYGNLQQLFNNMISQDSFSTQLKNNTFNSTLTSSFNNINELMNAMISAVNLTNLPNSINANITSHIDNSLYYQILANKILAKQQAENIESSNSLYPGSEYNIKNFPWQSIGYLYAGGSAENYWFKGWSKYTQILAEATWMDFNTPYGFSYYGVPHDFNLNLFDNTPWSNVPNYNLGKSENLIYKSVLNGENSSIDNNTISPLGIMGLFEVNHFLNPNQQEGIALAGTGTSLFGTSDQGQVTKNIKQLINGIIQTYQIYDLDTIDIDYEYPWNTWEQQYYIELIKELRSALNVLSVTTGLTYTISATTAPTWTNVDSIWIVQAQTYLNYINLMTYDMVRPSVSDIAGGNSKIYQIQGGSNIIQQILTSSSTSIELTNELTNKVDTLQKIPNYVSTTSSMRGASVIASYGIEQWVQQFLNEGIDPSKLLLGEAGYAYGWKIQGDGPIKEYPGMFGYLESGSGNSVSNQPSVGSFMSNIKDGIMKIGFNPYTGNSYGFIPSTHWYYSFDFISSTLAKIELLEKYHLGGFLVWTMNYQYNPSLTSDEMFNFDNSVSANGVISNMPVLATYCGLYSGQEIYNIWKNYLPTNFLTNFSKYFNIE